MQSKMPSTTEIVTFGCRLNSFESEVMRQLARDAKLENTVIVNTCAVTAEAERQARQAIRRLRRRRPNARIIVTGCAAHIDPIGYDAMPEVDIVLDNNDKLQAKSFSDTTIPVSARPMIDRFHERARAFVQVQNGCDHRCTFCIIPQGRGSSRSVPMGEIANQLRRLAANGVAEAVLSGVDITSYGSDLPGRPSLGHMVRRVLRAVPELPRLRLSSLDPAKLDQELLRAIAEERRLMPHVHLSLQSGGDLILKRMRRRHSRAHAIAVTEKLRELRPGIVFGADLIAGFPTETHALFTDTLSLVKDCGLTYLHVFPYSPRANTAAARMPQVAPAVRNERAACLRDAGAQALSSYLKTQVGQHAVVLVEQDQRGYSEHFAPVILNEPTAPGSVVTARIIGATKNELRAEARTSCVV